MHLIILWLVWLLFGAKFQSSQAKCSANATSCTLFCSDSACYNTIIECPTTIDCESCTINCDGASSCEYSTIYGHSCTNVTVNGVSGDDSMYGSTIVAPDNGGSLYVNVIAGDDCFKYGKINSSSNTNEIHLNCPEVPDGDNDECKNSHINASSANYFEMICSDESKCSESSIVCPDDGLCVIDCSTVTKSKGCEKLNIYTSHTDGRFIDLSCNDAVSCFFLGVIV